MPFFHEFFAEFDEIVDLAIEDQPERIIFVCHWLEAVGRKIDYSEPPVDEASTTVYVQPLAIRTAMEKPFRHGCEELAIRFSTVIAILTCDPAHSPDR